MGPYQEELPRPVDRFRPFTRAGSAPYHWILDEVGAQLIACFLIHHVAP